MTNISKRLTLLIFALAGILALVSCLCCYYLSRSETLHVAVVRGNTRVVRFSLALGADVNARDCEGRTPLYKAVLYDHLDLVKLLVHEGADINAASEWRATSTPLLVASAEGHVGIIEYLLKQGADVNAASSSGATALHFASWHRNLDALRLLLREGADVHAATVDGNTCLHSMNDYSKAFSIGYEETMRILIEKGADVNATNRYGKYPLFDAIMFGNKEVVAELLKHGANPKVSTAGYGTPQKAAARSSQGEEIATILRNWEDWGHSDSP